MDRIQAEKKLYRKFTFFGLSDAEKFAEFYGTTFSKSDKNGGDIGVG